MGKTIIGDDTNFLFEKPKNTTIWSTSSFSTYYYLMSESTTGVEGIHSMLYCLNFYIDKDYTYYRRWYMKISEALAIVSTFVKITDVVLKEIATFFNNIILFDNLSSLLFINCNSKMFRKHSLYFEQSRHTKNSKDYSDTMTNNFLHKSNYLQI